MKAFEFVQRRRLIELSSDLSYLELELEDARDQFKEASTAHNQSLASFLIEEKLLKIKKTKYDIQYIIGLLEQN